MNSGNELWLRPCRDSCLKLGEWKRCHLPVHAFVAGIDDHDRTSFENLTAEITNGYCSLQTTGIGAASNPPDLETIFENLGSFQSWALTWNTKAYQLPVDVASVSDACHRLLSDIAALGEADRGLLKPGLNG